MEIRPASKHFVPLLGVVTGASAMLFDVQHAAGLVALWACTALGVAGWLYEVVRLVYELATRGRQQRHRSLLFDGSMIELACWMLWFVALTLLTATLCAAHSYFWPAALGHADAHWHVPHYSGVHSSLAALLHIGNAVTIVVLESGFAHMVRPVSVFAESLLVPVLLSSALLELLVVPVAVARFTRPNGADEPAKPRLYTLPDFFGLSPLVVTALYVLGTYAGLSALLATLDKLVASTCVLVVLSAAFGLYSLVIVYGHIWRGYLRQHGPTVACVRDGRSPLADTVYEWLVALFSAYIMVYALAVGVHVALVQCEMLARPGATHSVLLTEMPLHGDQAYVRTLRCAYYIVFAFVSGGHGRYEPAHAISASVLTGVVLVLRAVRIGVMATGVEALLQLAERDEEAKADAAGAPSRRRGAEAESRESLAAGASVASPLTAAERTRFRPGATLLAVSSRDGAAAAAQASHRQTLRSGATAAQTPLSAPSAEQQRLSRAAVARFAAAAAAAVAVADEPAVRRGRSVRFESV
jgi:hypothetical protein